MTKFYQNTRYFATTVPLSHTATARSRNFFTGSGSSKKSGSGSTTLVRTFKNSPRECLITKIPRSFVYFGKMFNRFRERGGSCSQYSDPQASVLPYVGDADVSPLEDWQQEVRSDLPDGS